MNVARQLILDQQMSTDSQLAVRLLANRSEISNADEILPKNFIL